MTSTKRSSENTARWTQNIIFWKHREPNTKQNLQNRTKSVSGNKQNLLETQGKQVSSETPQENRARHKEAETERTFWKQTLQETWGRREEDRTSPGEPGVAELRLADRESARQASHLLSRRNHTSAETISPGLSSPPAEQ